ALRTALPLLDHHPTLKTRVGDALKRAATEPAPQRSFTLREAIEEVRRTVRPASAKTLWARLGGEPAVRKVVHEFVVAAAANPKINFTRGGKYKIDGPKLEQQLVEF